MCVQCSLGLPWVKWRPEYYPQFALALGSSFMGIGIQKAVETLGSKFKLANSSASF